MAHGQNTPGFIPDTTQSAAPTQSATPGFIPDTSGDTSAPPAAPNPDTSSLLQPGETLGPVQASPTNQNISAATHVFDPKTGTISAMPKTSALGVAGSIAQFPMDPIGVVGHALDRVADEIENYTQEGREEHPILSRIGDVTRSAKELLTGGQSAGKPMGTRSGVLNNPTTTAMSVAPGAADAAAIGQTKLVQAVDAVKAARVAKTAEAAEAARAANAGRITEIEPRSLTYREPTPAPQHGTPVQVASPLDRPTIDKLAGGKDLSPEAAQQLQTYARATGSTPGAEIEVGGTPKNLMHKLSEPVQKTLTDAGIKMNKVIQDAQPFKTSVLEDGKFDQNIDAVRDNFPAADEEKLNATVDKEIQSADDALRSTNPSEVLSYRRKLGTQIDWNNIAKNPQSPGEAQNVTRAKLYGALGDKLRTEIPEVAKLDKTFETNLELQRFLDKNGVDRNPILANAEHQSELAKGKMQIENAAHNKIVARNREIAGQVLKTVAGAAGVAGLYGAGKAAYDAVIGQ